MQPLFWFDYFPPSVIYLHGYFLYLLLFFLLLQFDLVLRLVSQFPLESVLHLLQWQQFGLSIFLLTELFLFWITASVIPYFFYPYFFLFSFLCLLFFFFVFWKKFFSFIPFDFSLSQTQFLLLPSSLLLLPVLHFLQFH